MKVFLYEYICGGGLAGRPLPESLAREGWAMLASIVEDFSQVEGCEVVTTLDERFAGRPLAARWVERMRASAESCAADAERRIIERLASECDWTLIIAPEFDGILFDRVNWAERADGRLLGSSSQGVAAAADKFACGQLLERADVPAVVGQLVRMNDWSPRLLAIPFPAVLKPRDGAGSQHTFLVSDTASLNSIVGDLRASGGDHEFLLQPFVSGMPVSVSFLAGPATRVPLRAGEQILSSDGRFQYLGGRLPLPPDESRRAVAVATRAVAAMPGLNGFVGVDLVLGQENLKSQISDCKLEDTVIEINPRLTTPYVGLRRLARANLAEHMLRVAGGETIEPIAWVAGTVGFSADGRVAYSPANPLSKSHSGESPNPVPAF